MEERYPIHILSERPQFLQDGLGGQYSLEQAPIKGLFLKTLSERCKLVVLDLCGLGSSEFTLIQDIKALPGLDHVPIVVMYDQDMQETRLQAFELGCDDYIHKDVPESEIALRCEKLIFNKIANDQLQAQVKQANEMAFIAMSDTSDLGVNIQFLLDVHTCTNLDELGMRLLQAVNSYGLNTSLQLRSELGVKNMDLSGIAKDIEVALMWELKDDGRYIDFGKRSVMNYEHVSLLVKNMPVDDEKKYGAIKDNIFSLLQGADARLKALENIEQVNDQQKLVRALSLKMQTQMEVIDEGYQGVVKDIADVVEGISDGINEIITNLALHEEQERALEKVVEYGLKSTNQIFSEGLKLDESFQGTIRELGGLLSSDKVKLTHEQRLKMLEVIESM
jgi:CheY-like chemotaxis protein